MSYLRPTKFFTTSGKGLSDISEINAFDIALREAGIGDYNLVCVSSILPMDAEEIQPVELPPGTIVFVVLAKRTGNAGRIAAGVGWAQGVDGRGRRYGCIIESNAPTTKEELERELGRRLDDLCKRRGIRPERTGFKVESLEVPKGKFGCVVAAVVLL